MKRIGRLILTFAMLFVVGLTTACGSSKPITKTFYLKKDDFSITETITYKEKEDKVLKFIRIIDSKISATSEEAKEEMKNILKKTSENYKDINGITETLDIQKDTYTQILEINYEKLDVEKAQQKVLGFKELYYSENNLSAKKRIARYLEMGYVEQEAEKNKK